MGPGFQRMGRQGRGIGAADRHLFAHRHRLADQLVEILPLHEHRREDDQVAPVPVVLWLLGHVPVVEAQVPSGGSRAATVRMPSGGMKAFTPAIARNRSNDQNVFGKWG